MSLHIGTSGWRYPEWKGTFYPDKWPERKQLAYYAEHFHTVELNSPFYHLPKPQTCRLWHDTVPAGFVFAVKASRYITHIRRLAVEPESIDRLIDVAQCLGDKLGPILFQLPPNWACDTERLAAFLSLLPPRHRYTIEFREPSWHNAAVDSLLRAHHIAFCMYDLKGFASPRTVTADFAYIRLHGPLEKPYLGSYGREALAGWAADIRQWLAEGKDVYCYFDNTMDGSALHDARLLLSLVNGEGM